MLNSKVIAQQMRCLTWEELDGLAWYLASAAQQWADDRNQIDNDYMARLLISWCDEIEEE